MNVKEVEGVVLSVLRHVQQEFPHSQSRVYDSVSDYRRPKVDHPVFYGSFDWHSCVHGYWTLLRALQRYPDADFCSDIESLFAAQLTPEKLSVERDFFLRPSQSTFERPYGWAWFLKLASEFKDSPLPKMQRYAENLQPLADTLAERFINYLPKLRYPIHSGQHNNTAFSLILLLDYVQGVDDPKMSRQLLDSITIMYGKGAPINVPEPGGEDFLSPGWQQALLMMRVLPTQEFENWMVSFIHEGEYKRALFTPVAVSDGTDGRLAHLDGLNLSRAWCMARIAERFIHKREIHASLMNAAEEHLSASSQRISEHYMGEHWLATFLFLALDV